MKNSQTPTHVAVIMDGNRRWAKRHKLELITGHQKGAEQIEEVVERATERGIHYITFWAFSTENWKRNPAEVAVLLEVFRRFFKSGIPQRFIDKGARLNVLGDYRAFPQDIVQSIENLLEKSRDNKGITINMALNYGGRMEIIRAIKQMIEDQIAPESITNETVAQYLYTKDQPDPDLIIRTGGEKRFSGFLPWQSEYSELLFTDTLWPDYDGNAFDEALNEFARRQRRFGT